MACTVEKGSEEVHNQEDRAGLGGPDGGGGRDPEYASRAGCKQVTSLWTVQSQGPGEGWLSPEASRRVCATEGVESLYFPTCLFLISQSLLWHLKKFPNFPCVPPSQLYFSYSFLYFQTDFFLTSQRQEKSYCPDILWWTIGGGDVYLAWTLAEQCCFLFCSVMEIRACLWNTFESMGSWKSGESNSHVPAPHAPAPVGAAPDAVCVPFDWLL